jgi:hypothetical protein
MKMTTMMTKTMMMTIWAMEMKMASLVRPMAVSESASVTGRMELPQVNIADSKTHEDRTRPTDPPLV